MEVVFPRARALSAARAVKNIDRHSASVRGWAFTFSEKRKYHTSPLDSPPPKTFLPHPLYPFGAFGTPSLRTTSVVQRSLPRTDLFAAADQVFARLFFGK